MLRTKKLTKFKDLKVGYSGESLNVSIEKCWNGGNCGNWSLQEGLPRVVGQ